MLYHTLAVLLIVFSNIYCTLAGEGCITGIDLYAGTGGITDAGSSSWFQYEFHYKTDAKYSTSFELYDRPGDDMTKNKGDFWTLGAPEACVKAENILDECYIKPLSGSNGWYVEDSITYGELDGDKQNLILISHNYDVNSWADSTLIPPQDTVTLLTHYIARDNCAIQDQCIQSIYFMAESADDSGTGSNDAMNIYLNDIVKQLPDLPGNDFDKHKADLWKITASEFGISGCLKFGDVTKAGVHSGGKRDGWYIKNAFISVYLDSGNYALLAGDRDWFMWAVDYDWLDLTMKNQCTSQDINAETPEPCEKDREETMPPKEVRDEKPPCVPETKIIDDHEERTMPPCVPET